MSGEPDGRGFRRERGWAFWVPSHNNHPLVIRPKEETRRCEHRASGVFFRCARQDTGEGRGVSAAPQPNRRLKGRFQQTACLNASWAAHLFGTFAEELL